MVTWDLIQKQSVEIGNILAQSETAMLNDFFIILIVNNNEERTINWNKTECIVVNKMEISRFELPIRDVKNQVWKEI